MPIEIKEMYIKINVDESANTGINGSGSPISSEEKSDFLAKCVEEVMEIINRQKER
jgi:fructose-1-phosphate kinase PfkB-like protein